MVFIIENGYLGIKENRKNKYPYMIIVVNWKYKLTFTLMVSLEERKNLTIRI